MSEQYKNGDQYWIIDNNDQEAGWQAARWIGDGEFETYDGYTSNFTVGLRMEPPPLPKKEEELPKGVEVADAVMAIFGYRRVDWSVDRSANLGHLVSYTLKTKETA